MLALRVAVIHADGVGDTRSLWAAPIWRLAIFAVCFAVGLVLLNVAYVEDLQQWVRVPAALLSIVAFVIGAVAVWKAVRVFIRNAEAMQQDS
jgi:hypothetical protein